MKSFITNIVLTIILSVVFVAPSSAHKKKHREGPLTTFGDLAQIINPVISGTMASQEKGFGHFGLIYGQTTLLSFGIKEIGKHIERGAFARPRVGYSCVRYDGMPSAHTASAWSAASYTRAFSENQWAAIPLYISAALTGYSRVYSRQHTTLQVVAGAALAEAVTFVNQQLSWSSNYQSTLFSFDGDELSAGFVFKF